MNDRWRELDLAGGGLQSANRRLVTLLKKRGIARALLALFPLGLHRDYLDDRRGAWLYRAATALGATVWLLGYPWFVAVVLAAEAACAVRDLWRIEDRVAGLNKQLRMKVYLGTAPGVPPGFRGHYTDADSGRSSEEQSRAGPDSAATLPPALSFVEQEKRLREHAASRGQGGGAANEKR